MSLGDNPTTPKAIRAVEIDGEPWFVAADVCTLLDLKKHPRGGYSHLTRRFGLGERRVLERDTHMPDLWGTFRPSIMSAVFISESGLYKLILRSDKPEARKFQDWVTRDVLPAIRKDGAYVAGEEKVATGELSEDEFILRALEIHVRDGGSVGTNNAARKLDADEKSVVSYAEAHRMGLKDGVSHPRCNRYGDPNHEVSQPTAIFTAAPSLIF